MIEMMKISSQYHLQSCTMIFRGVLLLFLLGNVRTSGNLKSYGLANRFDRSMSYSYWPSMLNAAGMMRIRKRELERVGQNEGGGAKTLLLPTIHTPVQPLPSNSASIIQQPVTHQPLAPPTSVVALNMTSPKIQAEKPFESPHKVNINIHGNETTIGVLVPAVNASKTNETLTDVPDKVDLSGPGVVKRGVIVFGGFALLAVAYFLFYRRKGINKDQNNTHNAIDANQFRYGVLQSEDRRDNLELSRVPLTMESDEDEDDDLEIFDLEQKKKSLSYVNLQVNDEEVVNGPKDHSRNNESDNLLLDIEDVNSEAFINWSNSGNRSIL